MTDIEKIEALARFMGWHVQVSNSCLCKEFKTISNSYRFTFGKGCMACSGVDWNPLTDWNHWRQVEEKVMEDETLMQSYFDFIDGTSVGYAQLSDGSLTMANKIMKATLSQRVDALLAALNTISPSLL